LESNAFLIDVFEFVILIFSLCVHESAHAWMASRLGDQTARMLGRVSLNPMVHVDPIGTLLLPAIMIFGPLISAGALGGYLIGWAKPTPVNTRYFRKFVRDDNLVTLAGPVSNLLLALAAFLGKATMVLLQDHLPQTGTVSTSLDALWALFGIAILVNLSLFLFNLLPIPPLDGSHILRHHLPYRFLSVYDNLGMFSYLLMIFVGGPIVGFLMVPALSLVDLALAHI
jgi:Zn-dependent protease